MLAAGIPLLATTLFGSSIDGITRWVNVGGLSVQPSLIIAPAMLVSFAGSRGWLSTLGVVFAALALGSQPDRAVAGAMVAGLGVMCLLQRDRFVWIALASAVVAFAITLVRADNLSAMPFVEQVYLQAFKSGLLAGIAVVLGAALLLAPAVAGWRTDPPTYLVFGTLWLALIVAAVLGNYPTPIVGYGSSSIVGYVLSLMRLSPRRSQT